MTTVTKKKSAAETDDLDSWVQSMEPASGCKTCANTKASAALKKILEAMKRTRTTHITIRQIHRKIKEMVPNYNVGYWGFRSHLYEHERELYEAARGKDH